MAKPALGHPLRLDSHPAAMGMLYRSGLLLSPAVGALLMSVSTVIVTLNSRSLKLTKQHR